MAAKSLKADLESAPNNVLQTFGESVKMSPNCLRGLFQTAIRTSRPDEGLLQQMIRVALNAYPEESSLIAEVCMEEAPEKANAIKAAFVSVPKTKQKKSSGNRDWLAPVSPIDRFLNRVNKMPAEIAEEGENDKEADKKIQEALSKMAAKIEGKSKIVPTPTISLPPALMEERTLGGRLPEKDESKIVFAQPDKIKVTPDVEINLPIEITTLDNTESLRINEESVETSSPVIMFDNKSSDHTTPKLMQQVKSTEQKSPVLILKKASPSRSLNAPSTVYYIPPPLETDSVGKTDKAALRSQRRITLRSNPISPTSPR